MPKVPSMSSKKLVKILEKGGAVFVRQGSTDHAICSRILQGQRYLDPVYCKRIFKQLRFSDEDIEQLL